MNDNNSTVYCLKVVETTLNDELRGALLDTAILMHKFRSNGGACTIGFITITVNTRYTSVSMGSIRGILFHAEIKYGTKTGWVTYVIRTEDLSAGDPYDISPIEGTFPFIGMSSATTGLQN